MNTTAPQPTSTGVTYYVDEAGDGVLFGPKGRDRLADADAPQFFMLGMVRCGSEGEVTSQLTEPRVGIQRNPLYATICSLKPGRRRPPVLFMPRMTTRRYAARRRKNKTPMNIGFADPKTMKHTAWSRILFTGNFRMPHCHRMSIPAFS